MLAVFFAIATIILVIIVYCHWKTIKKLMKLSDSNTNVPKTSRPPLPESEYEDIIPSHPQDTTDRTAPHEMTENVAYEVIPFNHGL